MSERISERDLILPALWCINLDSGQPTSTTQLQSLLRELLHPAGEDLARLNSRRDDRFSQKVRNLRSHHTLETFGFAIYESRGNNGFWTITEQGKAFLRENLPLIEYLLSNNFDYVEMKAAFNRVEIGRRENSSGNRKFVIFDERLVITEGERATVERQVYVRSRRLREIAIEHYSRDGKILCCACSFDFEAIYGEIGRGFIEIHHVKPILAYEDDDVEQIIQDALSNVAPLCSNCHRMVHRRRGQVTPIQELIQIIRSSNGT